MHTAMVCRRALTLASLTSLLRTFLSSGSSFLLRCMLTDAWEGAVAGATAVLSLSTLAAAVSACARLLRLLRLALQHM